ncbi:hypothetical protein MHBO_001642 [Bonamia ostreae]|uniref:Uncharacterized protein n=1 Tax=Bonamia ostreae TaxID=126728 RepID=A0ABV2AJN0_9EUKA
MSQIIAKIKNFKVKPRIKMDSINKEAKIIAEEISNFKTKINRLEKDEIIDEIQNLNNTFQNKIDLFPHFKKYWLFLYCIIIYDVSIKDDINDDMDTKDIKIKLIELQNDKENLSIFKSNLRLYLTSLEKFLLRKDDKKHLLYY